MHLALEQGRVVDDGDALVREPVFEPQPPASARVHGARRVRVSPVGPLTYVPRPPAWVSVNFSCCWAIGHRLLLGPRRIDGLPLSEPARPPYYPAIIPIVRPFTTSYPQCPTRRPIASPDGHYRRKPLP
jgi:hypothetical protein